MVYRKDGVNVLTEYFGRNTAECLCAFFENIWTSKVPYKVLMSRRAFNMNWCLMNLLNVSATKDYKTDSIMSDNGIMLCAEEISSFYLNYGYFPKILICDDILMHGRTIMRLITNLTDVIYKLLIAQNNNFQFDYVKGKLAESITVYVLAKSERNNLFDSDYSFRVEANFPMPEIRGLSQQISSFILDFGTANTSYVLSGNLTAEQENSLLSHKSQIEQNNSFCYRGRNELVYYRNISGIIQTVRIHTQGKYDTGDRLITGLALTDDYDKDNFQDNCRFLSAYLSYAGIRGSITKLLSTEDALFNKNRMQMMQFILSVFCLTDFCRAELNMDNDAVYHLLINSDYKKIACNFGHTLKIKNEFLTLFNKICYENLDITILYNFVKKKDVKSINTNNFKDKNFVQINLETKEKDIFNLAEDIFYLQGLKAEKDASFFSKNDNLKYDYSKVPVDELSIKDYLHLMNVNNFSRNEACIGTMLSLMDSGLISLNIGVDIKNNSIGNVIHAGELATSVNVRRFSVFIPAFAYIEQKCDWNRNYSLNSIKHFIRFLSDHPYRHYSEIKAEDSTLVHQLLEELDKENLRSKSKISKKYNQIEIESNLLTLYLGDQYFWDWNTEKLLVSGDRDSYNGNRLEFHMSDEEEQKRKDYYIGCAQYFLKTIFSEKLYLKEYK